MSKTAVNQVIQRAISDAAFRRQLQHDPGKTLAGFDLSKDERAAITSGDPTRLTGLGVDQRMSKAFIAGGVVGDASKSVIGDPARSGASTFIDEASAAGTAAAIAPDGSGGVNAMNMRLVEGSLDTGAAAVAPDSSGGVNATNMRLIEGSLDTGAATTAGSTDASGGFNAFDPGAITGSSSAVADSANATNLRRIEADLDTTGTAFESTDASGGSNSLDAGAPTGGSSVHAPYPDDGVTDQGVTPDSGEASGGNSLTE